MVKRQSVPKHLDYSLLVRFQTNFEAQLPFLYLQPIPKGVLIKYVVGDCIKHGWIMDAVNDGYRIRPTA